MSNDLLPVLNWTAPTLSDHVNDELAGLSIAFDRIRVPGGGSLQWELPDGSTVQEIVGVIVHHHHARAYWADPYAGGNARPDCSSMDGAHGVAASEVVPWDRRECNTCPLNAWGSGGRGKACRELHRLYLLREGEVIPSILTLPPTSLRSFANYIARQILPRGVRVRHVVTGIGLTKAKSSTGIVYSQTTFRVVGVLNNEIRSVIDAYSREFASFIGNEQIAISSADYSTEEQP